MTIKIPIRQWLFSALILSLMLYALVHLYPGALAESIELTKQVMMLINGE